MDAGHEPTTPIMLSNLPPPSYGASPTQPIPTERFPTQPYGIPVQPGRRPPARWTGAAKATAAVLALSTLGGVGFGISQFTSAHDRADRIVTLQQELDDANAEIDGATAELDDAASSAADLQAQLATVNGQLAEVSARRDALAGLFPLAVDAMTAAPVGGTWGLVNTTDASQCSGLKDPNASCVPDNFPTDLVLEGAPDTGYTASSAWYPPIVMTFDGSQWSGSGPTTTDFSNTCGGEPNTTTVSLAFSVAGVSADDTSGTLTASALRGSVTLASDETPTCLPTSRSATFVSAAG